MLAGQQVGLGVDIGVRSLYIGSMDNHSERKGNKMDKPNSKLRHWIETADHTPPTMEEAISYGWLPERRLTDRRIGIRPGTKTNRRK